MSDETKSTGDANRPRSASGAAGCYVHSGAESEVRHKIEVSKIETFWNDGEEWTRIIGKGGPVEILVTNPRLPSVSLGDTIELSLRVLDDDAGCT